MIGNGLKKVGQMLRRGRSFFTSSIKRGGHDDDHHDIGGIPGNVSCYQSLQFYTVTTRHSQNSLSH